jgi:predicted transcriptional regulator
MRRRLRGGNGFRIASLCSNLSQMSIRDMPGAPAIGDRLRDWRERRRLSQMALALQAEVSTRHLSFVETGRSQPGRALIVRLADELQIP